MMTSDMVNLVERARVEMGLEPGEVDMFVLDSVDAPSHAIAMVAQADVKALANKERVMGVCAPVPYLAPGAQLASGEGGSLPNLWAKDYFYMFEKRDLALPSLRSVEIITQPKHGKVVLSKDSGGDEILQHTQCWLCGARSD